MLANKSSFRLAIWGLISIIMIFSSFTIGCRLSHDGPFPDPAETGITGLPVTTSGNSKGPAFVAFKILLPTSKSGDGQKNEVFPAFNIQRDVASSSSDTIVIFTLTIINQASSGSSTFSLSKTVVVKNGVAETTFDGIPAVTSIGEIHIIGGHIGGFTDFHGASDLAAGSNTVELSPVGSGMKADVLVRVLTLVIQSREIIDKAPSNLCGAITVLLQNVDFSQATATADVTVKLLEQIKPSSFVKFEPSIDKKGFRGLASDSVIWEKSGSQILNGFDPLIVSSAKALSGQVLRHGLGGYGIVTWDQNNPSACAITKIQASDGAMLAGVAAPVTLQAVLLNDSSIYVGGFNSASNCPVLFLWSDNGSSNLSWTGPNTLWIKNIPELAPVNGSNNPSVVSISIGADRKLICLIKDSAGLIHSFSVDPTDGSYSEPFKITEKLRLTASPGDGKVDLFWNDDGLSDYSIFWTNAPGVGTASAKSFDKLRSPFAHQSLENGKTYYYLLWKVQNGVGMSSYEVSATPQAAFHSSMASPVAQLTTLTKDPTNQTLATFTVGGNGLAAYKYKLDTQNYGYETLISVGIQLSNLGNGSHTLFVIGKDAEGNWQSDASATTFYWTIDSAAKVAVLSNTPSNPTNQTTAAITVGGTGVTAYEYKLDSGAYGAETPASTTIQLSGLASGAHSVSVIGKDAVGNWQATASATIYSWLINTTPPATPTVSVLRTNTRTPTVTGSLGAALGTSETLTVSVNGKTYSVGGGNLVIAGTAWTLTIPGSDTLSENTYTVTATVADTAGNSTTDTTTNELVIDLTIPVVSAPINASQTLKAGDVSTSTVQSNKAGDIYLVRTGELAGTQTQINTAVVANKAFPGKTGAVAGTAYLVTIPIGLVDGLYDIVAVDSVGNVASIASGWLTVDNTAPIVSAPLSVAQILKSGDTSTSTILTGEAGKLYLVKHGESAGTAAQINTACAANKGFLAKSSAVASTAYTVTLPTGLVDGLYDIVAVDLAGNASTIVGGWLTVDNTPPHVLSLSFSNPDGGYTLGDTINIKARFDQNVRVVTTNGTPSITLKTGATDRPALYQSGDATDTLVFRYVVQAGDFTNHLDYLSSTSLTLNSGTIADPVGNAAALNLPGPGASGSLGANGSLAINGVISYTFSGHLGAGKNSWYTGMRLTGSFTGVAIDPSGNSYVIDTSGSQIFKLSPAGTVLNSFGTNGTGDGQFDTPKGIALDSSGNIYVADTQNSRIEKFTSTGVFVTKWGGTPGGSDDGDLSLPEGIAIDGSDNVYVADTQNCRIQKFTASGTFVAKWGIQGSADGLFFFPSGVTVDGSGSVYVADTQSNRIQKFTSAGVFTSKFGASGSGDGQLNGPEGIAVDASGTIFVADTGNHRIQKFSSAGTFVTKWGTNGTADGQFVSPSKVAIDISGNVYVGNNMRIQKFSPTGTLSAIWGNGISNGMLQNPYGVAIDNSGNIYVADTSNNRIQKFSSTGAFVTKWGINGTGDGEFDNPNGVSVDGSGTVFVADTNNHRIQKFTSDGTFVSKFGTNGSGDGELNSPSSIAFDTAGNIFVADSLNYRVQKFSSSGLFVAKWGTEGAADGQFESLSGIAIDGAGNVFVADNVNDRVQKFTSAGVFISKFGGSGSGDGQLSSPNEIAVDSAGNVYVPDSINNRIQKFSPTGVFLAKMGTVGVGDGQFTLPYGIAIDSSGNIFVADMYNHSVEKFTHL
ncbi:MAG: hypothetical protein HQM09_04395 [Candidatus Riflebacteria bacterium]|nr:hypothetical protein [Candidatus Riflebacteria bacterium]